MNAKDFWYSRPGDVSSVSPTVIRLPLVMTAPLGLIHCTDALTPASCLPGSSTSQRQVKFRPTYSDPSVSLVNSTVGVGTATGEKE